MLAFYIAPPNIFSMDARSVGHADLHTHTCYSGFSKVFFIPYPESVTPPEVMVDAAVNKGMDVLCITDHNEIKGAWKAQRYVKANKLAIEVVAGEEIATAEGEILGLFLQERIAPGLSAVETIELIHDQGGLAVAPHPFSYRCPCLGRRVEQLKLEGIEVLNAAHRDAYVNRLALEEAGSYFAHTGGSDAHSPRMLGDAYTIFPGRTANDLYRAILRKETEPGGGPAPLRHWILWNVGIAHGVARKLIASLRPGYIPDGDPLARIYRMRRHNKVIAMCSCMLFMVTPLPIVCGILGEGWLRWKGRKKWKEVHSNTTG